MNEFNGYIHEERNVLDWVCGGETGATFQILNPSKDWRPQQSPSERQRNPYFDTNFCVTFSALRAIESILNLKVANGEIGAVTLAMLTTLGYVQNNKFNFNEAFTAYLSGTTRNGNSFAKVWESIRKQGLIPQADWKQTDTVTTYESLMVDPPQALKDKALHFLDIVQINWEWLLSGEQDDGHIETALATAPIQIAVPVCQPWDAVVPSCGATQPQHAILVVAKEKDGYVIYDTYDPFDKRLANDYCIRYAVRPSIVIKTVKETTLPFYYEFTRPMALYESSNEVLALQIALKSIGLLKVNPTGNYFEQTRRAVMEFQIKYGVPKPNNGVRVGPVTLLKLNEVFSKPVKAVEDQYPEESFWSKMKDIINIFKSNE